MDPFIGTPLTGLTEGDLTRLINDAIPEGLHLDYKQSLDIDNRDERKEFLRDITAFANAEGGLIAYGVEEGRDAGNRPTGIPQALPGITLQNRDAHVLSIEHLIRDGIDERLPGYEIGTVLLANGKFVLLIRVPASIRAPHMVVTCSPKSDPRAMRVKPAPWAKETLDEFIYQTQASHARSDHRQAA